MKVLGHQSPFPSRYDPGLLEGIPRSLGRRHAFPNGALPFSGEDHWGCYELTWLTPGGEPQVGILRFTVPADSPALIESKSLKLYLGSLTFQEFESVAALEQCLTHDLANCTGSVGLDLRVYLPKQWNECRPVDIKRPVLELADTQMQLTFGTVTEHLASHLLRSVCPVTGQPDYGTLVLSYQGQPIRHEWLRNLIVEHRSFEGFHEQCCEELFQKVSDEWEPSALSVGCFYTRRGGIDINPIRRSSGLSREHPVYLQYQRHVRQ